MRGTDHQRRRLALGLCAGLCACVVACTPSARDSNSVPKHQDPTAHLLGTVGPDGTCDPTVTDIDHEKPTAYLSYEGQPGELVTITFLMKDGSSSDEKLDLTDQTVKWHIPTDIYNGDIDKIKVVATSHDGETGTCFIPVS